VLPACTLSLLFCLTFLHVDARNLIQFHVTEPNWKHNVMLKVRFRTQTSRGIGYSSDSSMRTTWLILGLFSASGSTHLRAVKRARLRALVDGLVSMLGSNTSSERRKPTIILSQSTKFTYNIDLIVLRKVQ